MIIFEILVILIVFFGNVERDIHIEQKENRSPPHTQHVIIAAIMVLIPAFLMYFFTEVGQSVFYPLYFFAGLRGPCHDLLLNIRRGKKLDYVGEDDNGKFENSKSEIFFRKYGKQYIWKSLIFLACMGALYLTHYFNLINKIL